MDNNKSIGNDQKTYYYVGFAESKIIKSPEGPKTVFEPSELFHPNLTDIAIDINLNDYDPLIEQNIEKIAKQALEGGYISLIELAHILAMEEIYTHLLPELWDFYGFTSSTQIMILESHDERNTWIWCKEMKVDSVPNRMQHWCWLLWRWVETGSDLFKGWRPVEKLTLYDGNEPAINQSAKNFIRVSDLEKFFQSHSRICQIDLPMPQLLSEKGDIITAKTPPIGKTGDPHSTDSQEKQFVFKKTGPGWFIVFDWNPIGPMKGIGFDYMYYCIDKSPQEYSNIDLYKGVNAGRSMPANRNHMPVDEEELQKFQFGNVGSVGGRQDKTDPQSMMEIRNRLKELGSQREEAQKINDLGHIQRINDEIEEIEEYLDENERMGKLETFKDDETRISERVSRAIERAIDKLKVYDDKAYNHFHEAFKPIRSSTKRYKPTTKIPWTLT